MAILLPCWASGGLFGLLKGEPPRPGGSVADVSDPDVALGGWVLGADDGTAVGVGVDAAGGEVVPEGAGTMVENLMDVLPVGLATGEPVEVGKVRSPTSKSPGVKGCVCSMLRSESRQRIWMAGATVTWATDSVAVAKPQTPPRKSVVSVVHVKSLKVGRMVRQRSYCDARGKKEKTPFSPRNAVGHRLARGHWREALLRPRLGESAVWPDEEAAGAYGR